MKVTVESLNRQVELLKREIAKLKERMSVMETCTETWDTRFDDLERWQEKIDDKIDKF